MKPLIETSDLLQLALKLVDEGYSPAEALATLKGAEIEPAQLEELHQLLDSRAMLTEIQPLRMPAPMRQQTFQSLMQNIEALDLTEASHLSNSNNTSVQTFFTKTASRIKQALSGSVAGEFEGELEGELEGEPSLNWTLRGLAPAALAICLLLISGVGASAYFVAPDGPFAPIRRISRQLLGLPYQPATNSHLGPDDVQPSEESDSRAAEPHAQGGASLENSDEDLPEIFSDSRRDRLRKDWPAEIYPPNRLADKQNAIRGGAMDDFDHEQLALAELSALQALATSASINVPATATASLIAVVPTPVPTILAPVASTAPAQPIEPDDPDEPEEPDDPEPKSAEEPIIPTSTPTSMDIPIDPAPSETSLPLPSQTSLPTATLIASDTPPIPPSARCGGVVDALIVDLLSSTHLPQINNLSALAVEIEDDGEFIIRGEASLHPDQEVASFEMEISQELCDDTPFFILITRDDAGPATLSDSARTIVGWSAEPGFGRPLQMSFPPGPERVLVADIQIDMFDADLINFIEANAWAGLCPNQTPARISGDGPSLVPPDAFVYLYRETAGQLFGIGPIRYHDAFEFDHACPGSYRAIELVQLDGTDIGRRDEVLGVYDRDGDHRADPLVLSADEERDDIDLMTPPAGPAPDCDCGLGVEVVDEIGAQMPAVGVVLIELATGQRYAIENDMPATEYRFFGLCPGDYEVLAMIDVAGQRIEVHYDADGDREADPITLIENACPLDLKLEVPAEALEPAAQIPLATDTPLPPPPTATP